MKTKFLSGLIAMTFFLIYGVISAQTACSGVPSRAVLSGIGARKAMALANEWGFQKQPIKSWVTTEAVHFSFPDGEKVEVPMPDDRVLIAIAPYINNTHPCKLHYMSSCKGELSNVPVKVHASTPSGELIVNETVYTHSHGFMELWLPKTQEIDLRLEARNLKASGRISTAAGSDTCLTTFRLMD